MSQAAHSDAYRVVSRRVIGALILVSLGLPGAGAQDAGTHATAPRRAVADQRFELTVDTAAQALELGLAVSPTVVDPGASVGIVVVSNGGSGSVSIQAAVNGQILALDAQGRATVTAGPAGTYRIVARATDATETLERQAVFSVRDGADTVAPQALISTPATDAEVTTYTFDANGNELTRSLTRTVNGTPRTETTSSVYDAENRLIQQTDPTGAITRTTYNSAGKPITQTDALGRVTRYSYDANARLTRTEYPDGTAEATEYDANGNEVTRTDRQGRTTRMVYDELDRLVQTTHPDGSAETTEYDAAGRVIATIDAQNQRSSNEYDAAGRMTAAIDASGRRTEYEYDANGNRTKVTVAAGTPDARSTVTTYDALNRATRIDWPDGSSQSVVFRTDGRKQSETDPRGVTATYGYDATGRLISVQQSGIAAATTYAYDQTGAKTTQTDAKNNQVAWSFDGVGRSTSRTLPDGQTEAFEYGLNGQMTAHTTFGGQRITFSYDSAGRQTSRIVAATAATPARAAQFTYNADGQRATQIESGDATVQGATTYDYDARGRLIALQTPQGDLAWTYDPAGRISERSTAEGTTGYSYDGDGRLTTLTAPDGKTTSYVYDAAGRNTRSEQQLAGSDKLVTERRYDSSDRQVTIAHSKQSASATTLVAGQTIARGQGGAVTRIDSFDATASFDATTGAFSGNPARVQAFGYDANARLTAEHEYKGAQLSAFLADANAQATQATTYGYDSVGNRTSKTVATPAGTESTSYVYDANDRLTSETLTTATGSTVTTTYTWDGNGNLASKTTPSEYTGYVFDADNRLIEVRRGASSVSATSIARYGYDADGQRIRKETSAGTTHYLIDPTTTWPQVALEIQGAQRTAYVWGSELRQQARGTAGAVSTAPSEDLMPLQGHLGTTIAAIDRSGNIVERYEATAFGELGNASPRAMHQYTGEYWDAQAGLVYLRARWYEPGSGRMLSIDPAMGRASDARSLNRYVYAHSDAANSRDPSGMFTTTEINIGIGLSALTAASLYWGQTQWQAAGVNGRLGPLTAIELKNGFPIAGPVAAARARDAARAEPLPLAEDGHHTVPQYVCGHPSQWLYPIERSRHLTMHGLLRTWQFAFNDAFNIELQKHDKPFALENRDAFRLLAKMWYGRANVSNFILSFYETFGYADIGVSPQFKQESGLFVNARKIRPDCGPVIN